METVQLGSTLKQYYQTKIQTCQTCKVTFEFTAEEQKNWYENKKRYIDQVPIYCDQHFIEWNVTKKIKQNMYHYLHEIKNTPKSTEIQQKCAEAILDYYIDTGDGNIDLLKSLLNKINVDPKYIPTISKIKA